MEDSFKFNSFLDLFSFLTDNQKIKLKKIKVDDIFSSRETITWSFMEKCYLSSQNQSKLILEDNKKNKNSFMKISFLDFTDEIRIKMNKMELTRYKFKKIILNKNYKIPLTSKLSYKIIKKLLDKKSINLSKLKKSAELHMILFPALKKVFSKSKLNKKYLPIT